MAIASDDTLEKLHSLAFAKFFHAYSECSDDVQTAVREMIEIAVDPEADDDDRDMALSTIADALFPKPHDGEIGLELEAAERMGAESSKDVQSALNEMDAEEASFAERLRALMRERGLSQADLAAKIGVGQPAISMMLSRQCRPQRKTLLRLAEALGVALDDLWTAA